MRLAETNTAVILAAGLGSRLDLQAGVPKPLIEVGGITLAERVILALRAGGGIRRFIVTVGHKADVVGAHFEAIGRRHGVEIKPVAAADWRLGNGASMLAAKGHTGRGQFYLSMSDHLFDPAIAEALAEAAPGRGEMCLAVDRDKAGIFDIDDVTRVRSRDGRIEAIEKDLAKWDAADTGVMLCTKGLFGGLERAAAEGEHGLSDGLRQLANQGKAKIVDVSGHYWIDVDTPEAHREAEIQERHKKLTGAYRHADGSTSLAPILFAGVSVR
ncbi:MAG: NTP transferase domain-containing protein [Proteobacteria bacterium]|nr:NTP transferase domain-containing protein [Pseudomonadota bacterium]